MVGFVFFCLIGIIILLKKNTVLKTQETVTGSVLLQLQFSDATFQLAPLLLGHGGLLLPQSPLQPPDLPLPVTCLRRVLRRRRRGRGGRGLGCGRVRLIDLLKEYIQPSESHRVTSELFTMSISLLIYLFIYFEYYSPVKHTGSPQSFSQFIFLY